MKKLLIVSPFVYYPSVPHGGGALCWGQLKELAKLFEIHFICFYRDPAEIDIALPHLNTYCKTVEYVHLPINKYRVLVAKIKLMIKLAPVDASLYSTQTMFAKLKTLVNKLQPDAIFSQFPQMAQYVTCFSGYHVVHDVHDAFSVSGYRRYKIAKGLKKAFQFLNWLAWLKYESTYYAQYDELLTLTNQDRIGLEIFNPGINATVSAAAISTPTNFWHWKNTCTIGFIGSYAHMPNQEALMYLLDTIFPQVKAKLPGVKLKVAGKGLQAKIIEQYQSEDIMFLGMVPSSEKFVSECDVIAIPLLSGGGIKIKTLEAMACGCPVVATSIGAEETGAHHDQELVITDDNEMFVDYLIKTLTEQAYAEHLSKHAMILIDQHFSWDAKTKSLEKAMNKTV